MKQDAANKILETRLTAGYAGGVPILRANSPVERTAPSGMFATFNIDPIQSENVGLGNARSRTTGMIIIELYIPLGTGTRTGMSTIEVFGDVFRNQDFSGVMCYERILDEVGAITLEGEDIRRYKISCMIPFYYDRTD